jgi:uroporphyrinogen-III decarboxylase
VKISINERNRQRVKIAERMGRPDCVPFDFSIGDQFDFLHHWLGIDGKRFFLDPSYVLSAQLKFIDRFNGEGMLGPSFGTAIEPSYFGAKSNIAPDTSPFVIPFLDSKSKLFEFLENYKEPDPYSAGYFPLLTNTWYYFKQNLGELIGPPMGFLGPFDTAASLVGHTNMFMWVKEEPQMMLDLIDKITSFFVKSIEVRVELFKPDDNDLSIFDDSCGLISRDDFLAFEFPFVKRLYDFYCGERSVRQFHCDARLAHIADLFPDMGVNVLLNFDPNTDIAFFKENIGDRICLKGNVHPVKFMMYGTPESIREEVKRQIDVASSEGGFVLSTGGELDGGTPEENIDALIEAVEDFGAY